MKGTATCRGCSERKGSELTSFSLPQSGLLEPFVAANDNGLRFAIPLVPSFRSVVPELNRRSVSYRDSV